MRSIQDATTYFIGGLGGRYSRSAIDNANRFSQSFFGGKVETSAWEGSQGPFVGTLIQGPLLVGVSPQNLTSSSYYDDDQNPLFNQRYDTSGYTNLRYNPQGRSFAALIGAPTPSVYLNWSGADWAFGNNHLPQLRTCAGDINFDHEINFSDLLRIANSYGSSLGMSKYDSAADFDYNNTINFGDLLPLSQAYGQRCLIRCQP